MPTPRQVRPGWEFPYTVEGGNVQKGVACVAGSKNTALKIASAVGQGRFRGISIDAGVVPNGTADPNLPDSVDAQKQGIAQAMVPANTSGKDGDQAICDQNGFFVVRRPFSFSAFVWGQFDGDFAAGAKSQWAAIELLPHYIELVRNVVASGFGGGVIGVTLGKFFDPHAAALAAAPLPVYRVKYTGEVLRNLGVTLRIAPGGNDSVTGSFQKSSDGGVTWTDIAGPSAQAVGPVKIADDQINVTPPLADGDLIAIKIASTAGLAADPVVTFDAT
jgi:hypothetical protein